jgi:transcriptional regulator GlxA family with amidase domain
VLFKEEETHHCGQQAILDRQIEVVIILLLRSLMDQKRLRLGLLAGLADTKLQKAINAMHADPGRRWSLDDLAEAAGMSRARFAVKFKNVVGQTPGNYLTEWRLSVAQSLLSKGKSIQYVADTVGYGSASAFTRVFTNHLKVKPSEWKKHKTG